MSLSDLSIKKPVFAWMLMGSFLLFGAIGFSRLGVSLMPDVENPIIQVSVTLEGASPEVMESDVVDVIEDHLMTIQGIRQTTSSSRQGRAEIMIEFELDRDIDAALQDVEVKLAQARRLLPKDIDPPVLQKFSQEDSPIMWLALSGPRKPHELSDYIRNEIKQKFQTLPGVSDVFMGAVLERNVRVWIDARKLEAYRMTVGDVLEALQRGHVEVPGGRLETGSRELSIRSLGEALDVEGLRRLVVADRGAAPVRLQDVALVEDGMEDLRRVARSNGNPAHGMGIRKQRGASAVRVAQAVRARLAEVRRELPADLDLAIRFDTTPFVEDSIHEVQFSMLLAVILTSIICWLFLGSWSSTLNILLAIPTSVMGTFAVMYFAGFTLNLMTLLALSLSVGIVVDDAIMVMENIYRHAEGGKGRRQAAADGAREITPAAIASTAAIAAIFAPVAFMHDRVGRFFFQFGVTLSVAVCLSLAEALTIAPARCAQLLSVGQHASRVGQWMDRGFRRLARAYGAALRVALRWRVAVLGLSLAGFGASLGLVGLLKKELVPPQDQARVMLRVETPVGASMPVTDEAFRKVEEALRARPEVAGYFGFAGGFGGAESNQANIFVTLVPADRRKIGQDAFGKAICKGFERTPGMTVAAQDLSMMGFGGQRGYAVEFAVQGPDPERLPLAVRAVKDRMAASGIFSDVDTNYRVGMPELRIAPDRRRASDLGVDMASIGTTVQALMGGIRVGKYKDRGRRFDVRARLLADQRRRPEDIEGLLVRARGGDLVRLADVVRVEERPSPLAIHRRDRERSITVMANLMPGHAQAEAMAQIETICREALPEGYHFVWTGAARMFGETLTSLLFALVLGFVVAYMILASQFNSFIHPLTILLALPFSLTGALLLLWIAGQSLNTYSMIGILLLMGIAKKNSILLVDYTNQLRDEGKDTTEALLEACPVRLRPILMTALSTIVGAVPAAIALGPGGELRMPMALAVIGGMTFSTLLTFFVVPCAYSVFDSITCRLFGRREAAETARAAPAPRGRAAPE